jgi:hypothetical protein
VTGRFLLDTLTGDPLCLFHIIRERRFTVMRVRIFSWEYHTDPLRLADEVNECIKSCENIGETVLDADVMIRPNGEAKEGMEFLVIIKYEGNRSDYLLPRERSGEPDERRL